MTMAALFLFWKTGLTWSLAVLLYFFFYKRSALFSFTGWIYDIANIRVTYAVFPIGLNFHVP